MKCVICDGEIEKKYTVTEKELRAFYDAKGKVADALYDYTQETNVGVEHEIVREIWYDNVGPSFEFLLESVRLRNGDEEE